MKTKPKSKHLTNGAKIFAVVVTLVGLGLKASGVTPTLDMTDVLKVSGFIVLVFAPIDVSLMLQNIFKEKDQS